MVVAAAAVIIVCILFTGGYGLLSSFWAEETSVVHARTVKREKQERNLHYVCSAQTLRRTWDLKGSPNFRISNVDLKYWQ